MVTLTFDESDLMPRTLWMHLVKHRAGYVCEECGSADRLQSHHINEDANDHRLANGQCVCKPCHDVIHAPKRSAWMRQLGRRGRPSPNKGKSMSDAQRKKMRVVAAQRDSGYYDRAVAAKHRKGVDLSAVASKGWETRRRRAETL